MVFHIIIKSLPYSVNDMACCVISFTTLTDLISWYWTIDSLLDNDGVEMTLLYEPRLHRHDREEVATWQSPSPTCSRSPRNARFIMAIVMILFIIRSKHFLQKVASVAIYCLFLNAINALLRLPSPEWMLASIKVRLGFLV